MVLLHLTYAPWWPYLRCNRTKIWHWHSVCLDTSSHQLTAFHHHHHHRYVYEPRLGFLRLLMSRTLCVRAPISLHSDFTSQIYSLCNLNSALSSAYPPSLVINRYNVFTLFTVNWNWMRDLLEPNGLICPVLVEAPFETVNISGIYHLSWKIVPICNNTNKKRVISYVCSSSRVP